METIGVISIITILLFVYLLRRKKPVEIPVIYMGEIQGFKQGREVYNIDFTYATNDKGKDLILSDYKLFIVRGGEGWVDGDCILVDEKIKEAKDGYKMYVVYKYPPYSAVQYITITKKDDLVSGNEVIGAIVSKIPAEYIQKCRIK